MPKKFLKIRQILCRIYCLWRPRSIHTVIAITLVKILIKIRELPDFWIRFEFTVYAPIMTKQKHAEIVLY